MQQTVIIDVKYPFYLDLKVTMRMSEVTHTNMLVPSHMAKILTFLVEDVWMSNIVLKFFPPNVCKNSIIPTFYVMFYIPRYRLYSTTN